MTVMQQDDLPDSSSFVSLSRTLQEKLWSEEGKLLRSTIDESQLVWQALSLEKKTANDHLLAYNMIKYGRGGYDGMLYWDGDEESRGQVQRRLLQVAGTPEGQGRVLQIGCGSTASWCIEMCELHPTIEVLLLEVGAPHEDMLPPNLAVEVGPFAEGELSYPDEFFEVVYASLTMQRCPDFTRFLEECARVLRPGGILLLGEWDSKFYPASDDPRLKLCIDRDANYDAAMYRAFPQIMSTVVARNVTASSLGQLVRSLDCFEDVEEHCFPIDYTATEGNPGLIAAGKRFIYSGWEGNRQMLDLTAEDNVMMEKLDKLIVGGCPPGVLSDYYAVVAKKAAHP